MTDTQRNLSIGVGIALLIIVGIYFSTQNTTTSGIDTQSPIGTTTNIGGSVSGTGDYTVELVGTQPPALSPVRITADLSDEAKTILRQKIDAEYEILVNEPTRVDIWLQLGVNRKIGGDFGGAIEAWDYVAAAAPDAMRATAYGNLGDLYMYFLKDYAKAETNFKQAIALNSKVIEYYRALFYLYRDISKDSVKARAILTQGLAANPNHPDLLALQEQLGAGGQ